MNTKGNTILITGGATGIGYALAEAFIEAGNEVVICGRRENRLKDAEKKLAGVQTRVCDVADPAACEELIGWLIKKHPAFNMLINNAGIQWMLNLKEEISIDTIAEEIAINFTAPIQLTNLSTQHFVKQQEAAIVNVTSGLAYVPLAIVPVYCATKAALHSFSVSLRQQLRDTAVKVFEIIPPMVDTELGHGSRERRGLTDRGIPPKDVAVETLKALEDNIFEHPVGMAQHLRKAAYNDQWAVTFSRMNG